METPIKSKINKLLNDMIYQLYKLDTDLAKKDDILFIILNKIGEIKELIKNEKHRN